MKKAPGECVGVFFVGTPMAFGSPRIQVIAEEKQLVPVCSDVFARDEPHPFDSVLHKAFDSGYVLKGRTVAILSRIRCDDGGPVFWKG